MRFWNTTREVLAWSLLVLFMAAGCKSMFDSVATPEQKQQHELVSNEVDRQGREIVSLEAAVDAAFKSGDIDEEQLQQLQTAMAQAKAEKAALEEELAGYEGSVVTEFWAGATGFVRDYLPGPLKPAADVAILLPWLISPRGRENWKMFFKGLSPNDGRTTPIDSVKALLAVFGLKHTTDGSAMTAAADIEAKTGKS